MKRHEENALSIAKYLESSPLVSEVIYPGLPSHPQHTLAKKQQSGYGGMISFRIKNANLETSNKFLSSLRLFSLAESLGGVESLAELPAVMTHASVSKEQRMELGITDSLIRYVPDEEFIWRWTRNGRRLTLFHTIRLSVGIEDEQDLIRDIKQALETASDGKSKI